METLVAAEDLQQVPIVEVRDHLAVLHLVAHHQEDQEEEDRMKHLTTLLYLLITTYLFSQNEADLFRYSKHTTYGTARFTSMAGSFGALGADLSSAITNPAGLGRFSTSQFQISFSPLFLNTTTDFYGTEDGGIRSSFEIPNFGIVLTNDISGENSGDLYSQIGFGANRIANFNQVTNYKGQKYESMLDEMVGQAAGYDPSELYIYLPFSTSLAWESYAIDYDSGSGTYYSQLNSGDMLHDRTIRTKGGMTEWYLSYSRNRMNKLYWGASLAYRYCNYHENYLHNEMMTDTSTTSFRGFDYTYDLKTKGGGLNLKIGAIYLINEFFRVGGAFHSPTYLNLEDDWTADMTSYFANQTLQVPESLIPYGNYKYRLRTAPKLTASAAYIFGLRGAINIDAEWVGYSMARLKSTTDQAYEYYSYAQENAIAKARLSHALNLRIGGEYVIQQSFFIRGGIGIYSSAFKSEYLVDPNIDLVYSGGLGYRTDRYNIDVAYSKTQNHRYYYPFEGVEVNINNQLHQFVITGSVRF